MKYKWLIKESKSISKEFLDIAFNSEIIAKLLLNRGISSRGKAKSYLDPKLYLESKPEEIPNLLKAKDRIIEAINNGEKITIFGDYDVDGVTSTSCLLITLKQFTDKVDFYIPNRLTEGYGLNLNAVETIAKKNKAKLLITCDCGITNEKEIKLANELGMDVIVTDHHSLPEILPPACAVLNPKLLPPEHKLHWLPGVGVAYKLAEAILEIGETTPKTGKTRLIASQQQGGTKKQEFNKEDLLDLVTLGMIADLAPLVDENRYLVQIGLNRLASTEKVGLQELLKMCGINQKLDNRNQSSSINTEHVGFGIAPRINAVGRLTDAALAVRLLTTNDLLEAIHLTCELNLQNTERQKLCEDTLEEAITLVSERVNLNQDKCIVLANENWHHGVIGIVASRIVEKYHLPTILIAVDKEQNIARGSGRSIEKLNIVETLVKSSRHLEKFGGHKAACGLSVKPEQLNNFILDFTVAANEALGNSDLSPVLKITMELPIRDLNLELIKLIYKLAPFGFGNPMPVFKSEEVEIINIRNIGKNGQHLKLTIKTEAGNFEALIWNHDSALELKPSDKLKMAYVPKLNHYNNETFIQLEIKDWEVVQRSRRDTINRVSTIIELFDFRGKTQECLNLLSKQTESIIYFAEANQKNYLPLKTCSRNRISQALNLIFLDMPPDEIVFIDTLKKCSLEKIFFAFSKDEKSDSTNADELLKKLTGMLKYTKANKGSRVKESELQAALGINKNSLAFALETLVKIGFLSYERIEDKLNINISTPSRQNYSLLIEYNLLVSELKQISEFRDWIYSSDLHEILRVLNQYGLKSDLGLVEKERVLI